MAALGLGFLGLAWGKHKLLGYTTPNRVDKFDTEARITYLLDVFASIRRFIPPSFDIAGKDVLEMSPGSSRGIGVLFLALGARSYHAIDAFDLASHEDHDFYERLLHRFEGCSEPDRARALAAARDPAIFGYAVGRDFDIARLSGRRRFDLILSCAAFEHYDSPRDTVASLTQVARPDCETIHIIDMQTHSRWIRDRDPNNIYRFTAPIYRTFSFAGQPNRKRPLSFVSAFEDQEWRDVTFTALRTVDPSLRTVSLRDLAAPFDETVMEMDVLNGVLTGRRYGLRSQSVPARSP